MFKNKEVKTVKSTTSLSVSGYNADVDSTTLSGTNMAIVAGIAVGANVVTEAVKAGVNYLKKDDKDE